MLHLLRNYLGVSGGLNGCGNGCETDVRTSPNQGDYSSRIIVAGGGGGVGSHSY